jgi:hypothetical protein
VPINYDETFLRNAMPDVPGMLVDGRIPFGCWTHSAPPGGYKSAVGYQFAVAITNGDHLPGLDWDFTQRGDVLIIAPDETFFEQQDRSFRYRPFGTVDSDGDDTGRPQLAPHDDCEIHYKHPIGDTIEQRIMWMWSKIREVEATTGRKIVLIIWDTAASLAGTSEKNAYDQLQPIQELNHQMAAEQRVMMLPRHIGKDGTPIGSVGWDAYCNLNTVMEVKPGELTGVMKVNGKARGCQHWSAAVTFVNGLVGEITDDNPMIFGRTRDGSAGRKVLQSLAAGGPASPAELEASTGLKNGAVRQALLRSKRAGEVVKRADGTWELVDNGSTAGPPDGAPVRWEENGRTYGTCEGCNRRMLIIEPGQTTHPGCDQGADIVATQPTPEPGAAGQVPRGALGVIGPDEPSEIEQFKAFKSLEASIRASRKHPVPLIGRDKRDQEPWTLITERMSGEHRHRVDAPADSTVKVLDRRGSYPSAMSNVPVSANLLTRTGPLTAVDNTRAGIYQIPLVAWTDARIGHPLGRIMQDGADTTWVSTPHMRMLERLGDRGIIPRVPILDSWTGLVATNLFEGFYVDVREARKATADDEAARAEVKRMSSVAIRSLWLKNERLRSPFWRPDWSVSVRAEASVRHWMRAWHAVEAGAQLVALRQVDEAAFVVPDGMPMGSWVPAPYTVGENYGEVSVKSLLTSEEWNGARR